MPSSARVHVHRRDDDPVGQLAAARAGTAGTSAGRTSPPCPPARAGEPARPSAATNSGVAQPQVVVGDPPAAGHDVERELLRGLADVLADVLEPLQAGLRRALGGEHHRPPLGLVRRQRRRDVGLLVQAGGQRQRVLHRQLGARADGEVRGVRGVAEQHDVAVPPASRLRTVREAEPLRVVGQHRVPVEDVGEQIARSGRSTPRRLAPGGKARPAKASKPARRQTSSCISTMNVLCPRVVGVAVHLHHAVRRLADVELERVEDLVGAQPHVLAAAQRRASGRRRRRTWCGRRS